MIENVIENVEIGKLKEAPYNPRVKLEEGMPEYERLKKSINTFGNLEPVVWNKRTGYVVGGHQRLQVFRDMGEKAVPCVVVDLDEESEKVLNLALNKIKGEWDYDKLNDILAGFDEELAEISGFAADELALILGANEEGIFENISDGWEDDQDSIYGSYVVTLQFENAYFAKCWAEKNGYPGQIRDGTQTTVIMVEEKQA